MPKNNRPKTYLLSILVMFLVACGSPEAQQKDQLKISQYMIEGHRLFERHCENCHGGNGKGLGKLYPPLASADFMSDTTRIICIIKNGLKGEIEVNGTKFNKEMPDNIKLTDLEIAEISTYIYNEWSVKEKRLISTKKVTASLNSCK